MPAPENKAPTQYFTVHVTPEPHCSYASFETNVPHSQNGKTTADIIRQVIDIFKPGRFSITLFETKPSADEIDGDVNGSNEVHAQRQAQRRDPKNDEHIEGYRRVDRIVHDLNGYDLVFRYYERNGWKGGAPRIGEKF